MILNSLLVVLQKLFRLTWLVLGVIVIIPAIPGILWIAMNKGKDEA